MKIFVTGATGFTGKHVVRLLSNRGHVLTCLVRQSSKRKGIEAPNVHFVEGDLDDPATLENALAAHDLLINIAPLVWGNEGREPGSLGRRCKGILAACSAANVNRAIFISSTSIFTTIDAASKAAKLAAEEVILNSGFDYTILRPTMIYGGAEDRNIVRLIEFLQRYPVVPIPGNGKYRQQPIHVEDLAQAIVDCVSSSATIGKAYNLSGAEPVTFDEVVSLTCKSLGVKRLIVHIPVQPARWMGRVLPKLSKRTWIKEERLLRLNEDRCFDHSEATRDFGFKPRHFSEGIKQQILVARQSLAPLR